MPTDFPALKMELYTADVGQQGPPNVRITDTDPNQGPRMIFASTQGWIQAPGASARQFADAGPNDPGLFTLGQMFCIGVTLINWNGNAWTSARMVHISDPRSSMIKGNTYGFYSNANANYTAVDSNNLYVVISSKGPYDKIRQVAEEVKSNLPNLRDDHIWAYMAVLGANILGSAVSNDGYFGEP